MSEDTQINISTTTEIVNVDVTETLQPVSLECYFASGSALDTIVNVSETLQNIELNVTETEAQNVEIDYFYPAGPQGLPGLPGQSVWGTISGTLSTQTDLWKYLSGVGTSNFDIATLNNYLSTTPIVLSSLNVIGQILSAGTNLFDIFSTTGKDPQTLSFNVTGETLSIAEGNTVSLSSLGYQNIVAPVDKDTIQGFANTYTGNIHPGFNVTLNNGRVYTFAGIDKNNPNHYLEVNANPILPIYREIPLSGNEVIIDTFYLGDFKTAKYTLQIETTFNNNIYYSEINVVGSLAAPVAAVASEYGQIYTDQLILGYGATITGSNYLELIMYNTYDANLNHKYIVKGHRTNFYKI